MAKAVERLSLEARPSDQAAGKFSGRSSAGSKPWGGGPRRASSLKRPAGTGSAAHMLAGPDESQSRPFSTAAATSSCATWGTAMASANLSLSTSTIRSILNLPKSAVWRGLAPEFTEKQAAILGLYLSPREHALVIGVYEKAGAETGEAAPRLTPPTTPRPLSAGKNWRASLLAALAAHDEARVAEGGTEGEGGNGGAEFFGFPETGLPALSRLGTPRHG